MGIGGHMLGPKKLRRLSRLTDLPLRRAYRRGRYAEGVVWDGDSHTHYKIDPVTGNHEEIPFPWHWASCDNHGNPVPAGPSANPHRGDPLEASKAQIRICSEEGH